MDNPEGERAAALHSITALARQHGLSAQDIADALGSDLATSSTSTTSATSTTTAATPARGLLVRVLGYIGGTFVFAGVGVFIALQWDAMNPPARVVITLGSGLAAFVLAVLSHRDPRFEKGGDAALPNGGGAPANRPDGAVRRVRVRRRLALGGLRHLRHGGGAVRAVFVALGVSTLLFLGGCSPR